MYRMNVDFINKIIYTELSGSMSLEEIHALIADMTDLVNKFERGQYSMLFLFQRLDPFSQDNMKVIQKATELALSFAKKIAVIYGNRTVTKMQSKKIEAEARKNVSLAPPIAEFQVVHKAMNYLI